MFNWSWCGCNLVSLVVAPCCWFDAQVGVHVQSIAPPHWIRPRRHKEMIGHSPRIPIILRINHGFRCCQSPVVVLLENESENLCERPETTIIGSHTYCSSMRLCVQPNVARAPDAHWFYTMTLLGERSQQEPCKLFSGSLKSLLVLLVCVRCSTSWISCVLSRNGPALVNVQGVIDILIVSFYRLCSRQH